MAAPLAPYLCTICGGGFAAVLMTMHVLRAWVCRWGPVAGLSTLRSWIKLRPCPSYNRRRDRINLVPNFNSVANVVQPRGVWGTARVFDGKLYFTRDHMQGNFIHQELEVASAQTSPSTSSKDIFKGIFKW